MLIADIQKARQAVNTHRSSGRKQMFGWFFPATFHAATVCHKHWSNSSSWLQEKRMTLIELNERDSEIDTFGFWFILTELTDSCTNFNYFASYCWAILVFYHVYIFVCTWNSLRIAPICRNSMSSGRMTSLFSEINKQNYQVKKIQ